MVSHLGSEDSREATAEGPRAPGAAPPRTGVSGAKQSPPEGLHRIVGEGVYLVEPRAGASWGGASRHQASHPLNPLHPVGAVVDVRGGPTPRGYLLQRLVPGHGGTTPPRSDTDETPEVLMRPRLPRPMVKYAGNSIPGPDPAAMVIERYVGGALRAGYLTWKVMGNDTHTGTFLSRFRAGAKRYTLATRSAASSRGWCPELESMRWSRTLPVSSMKK
jgi:hypothetical protein